MLKHMKLQHIVVSFALVMSLVFLWNPFDFWMPTELELIIAGAVAVIASLYVGLIYNDFGRDEREQALRARAGRLGYLAGIVVLSCSIVFSLVYGMHPDLWVLVALAVMILARLYARTRE